MSEDIRIGSRVECRKSGPWEGKKGNVEDIALGGEILTVDFGQSTLIDSRDYFEKV